MIPVLEIRNMMQWDEVWDIWKESSPLTAKCPVANLGYLNIAEAIVDMIQGDKDMMDPD